MADKDNVIGESIIRLRKMHNMSQLQLAEVLGKSQSAICAYESGEVIPPFDVLLMIAEALDNEPEDMMGLKSKTLSTADLNAIYEIYRNYEEE